MCFYDMSENGHIVRFCIRNGRELCGCAAFLKADSVFAARLLLFNALSQLHGQTGGIGPEGICKTVIYVKRSVNEMHS